MITIEQAVIVEGKYDKIKLENILHTIIIETDGFGIFKDKKKQELIRRLADTRGIVVLTDSDTAGFKIRSFLAGIVPPEKITHAYIPDVLGKEKRKLIPSKDGKIGVEGMTKEIIMDALQKSGITCLPIQKTERRLVTKIDFYDDGLSGGDNSKQRKAEFLKYLNLPERLSSNSLIKLINTFMTFEEYKRAVENCNKN